MVSERIVEPKSKLNRALRVSMTNAVSGNHIKHNLTEKNIETVTPKGLGELGEKLNEICPAAKNMWNGFDMTEAEL